MYLIWFVLRLLLVVTLLCMNILLSDFWMFEIAMSANVVAPVLVVVTVNHLFSTHIQFYIHFVFLGGLCFWWQWANTAKNSYNINGYIICLVHPDTNKLIHLSFFSPFTSSFLQTIHPRICYILVNLWHPLVLSLPWEKYSQIKHRLLLKTKGKAETGKGAIIL